MSKPRKSYPEIRSSRIALPPALGPACVGAYSPVPPLLVPGGGPVTRLKCLSSCKVMPSSTWNYSLCKRGTPNTLAQASDACSPQKLLSTHKDLSSLCPPLNVLSH